MNSVENLSDLDLSSAIAEAERLAADEARRQAATESIQELRAEQQRRQEQQSAEYAAEQGRSVLQQTAPEFVKDVLENDRALVESLRLVLTYLDERGRMADRLRMLEHYAKNLATVEWNGIVSHQNQAIGILREYGIEPKPLLLKQEFMQLVYQLMETTGTAPRPQRSQEHQDLVDTWVNRHMPARR